MARRNGNRGRPIGDFSNLAKNYVDNNGRALTPEKFIDDKVKTFIRKILVKYFLLAHENLEISVRLSEIQQMNLGSNTKANRYRDIFSVFPSQVDVFIAKFKAKQNWEETLCNSLKIRYSGFAEDQGRSNELLVNGIVKYVKKAVHRPRRTGRNRIEGSDGGSTSSNNEGMGMDFGIMDFSSDNNSEMGLRETIEIVSVEVTEIERKQPPFNFDSLPDLENTDWDCLPMDFSLDQDIDWDLVL